jgi:menaquinone-9 beta-reductase
LNNISTGYVTGETNNGSGRAGCDVIVVGGGLSGLISAILLSRRGHAVVLFEKKQYPFHRVCGEYISNETVPFLTANGLFPLELGPERISRLQLTSVNGRAAELPLDVGGFGISRYAYDHFLLKEALKSGVRVIYSEVDLVEFVENAFVVEAAGLRYQARLVVGAHGKRSKLDHSLSRGFIRRRSPYVGVKYHAKFNHPGGLISLHNFKDGYCGISNIENGVTNICYLTHRRNMKQHGNVKRMEEDVLFRNPFLKKIFSEAEFLFDKPEVINEISFETKRPIERHILMAGDAAGMITPLCGNGMAMAIHSAKLIGDWGDSYLRNEIGRNKLELGYSAHWHRNFSNRLWAGRQIQRLFGSEKASDFAVNLARHVKPVATFLVRQTHGQPF